MPYIKNPEDLPTKGKGSKLSTKMELFVQHYLITNNGSEAVRQAGYKTKNEHKMAAELMRHPLVRKAIEEGKEERRERMELSADYLINKLIDIIDTEEEKTADKLRAIELAGKSLALWKERQEVSGPDGGAIEMQQKKVEEDVADFTSRIQRLATRGKVTDIGPGENS